jgi:tetratricopeptide (TPR) repeat protein
MRIPRPDRTVSMGAPNACNQCHRGRSPQWAADRIRTWFPAPKPGFQTFADALHAGDLGAPGARGALLKVIEDRAQPSIARASAIARLEGDLTPDTLPSVAAALNDTDPGVRLAAVRTLSEADPQTRLRYLPRMLRDTVRSVRMEAARALAGEPEARLAAGDHEAFDRALDEYVGGQHYNADRPEAQAALGNLHMARGRFDDSAAAFRAALRLDPTYTRAAVNLADLYRARGMEAEVEAVLREALKADPGSAAARHALGLALMRQKRTAEAMAALGEAARLAPDDARLTYVFGVALHDTGKRAEAIRVLEAALERHPYDRQMLVALGTYEREAGRFDAARRRAKLLRELEPSNPEFARIAAQLEGAGPSRRK